MIEAQEKIADPQESELTAPLAEKADSSTDEAPSTENPVDGSGKEETGEETEKETKKKCSVSVSSAVVFAKFQVFTSPDVNTNCLIQPKRRTSGSSTAFLGNDPYRPPEMSPETTLIEFISTSAAFHGVKKQNMRQLEWDILKVFTNNVMPANAAAWYMAKRRYYLDNAWENQLLPFLLKKYPDKFYVRHHNVEFLDVCSKDIARKKMNFMVNQGLYAYFSHKADEYGVYFFDPYYYEHTEPFHANLRIATNTHTGHRSKLLPTFFGQYQNNFVFTQHNPYLVTLSKVSTPIKINTTGIIVRMIDRTYGIIQFPSGSGTEKALFCTKALYVEAWQYEGNPLKLDAIKFDGYRIPGPVVPGRSYTWYAVLVWAGRKPSPKFCATKDDLMSNKLPHEREFSSLLLKSPTVKSPPKDSKTDDSMVIGEVIEIRKNGAVVSMHSRGTDDKAVIMGWRHENLRKKGYFLTTTQGVGLAIKDLVGYYIDPNQKMEPYSAIAHQIIVLKHAEEAARPNIGTHPLSVEFGSPNTRSGILRQLANIGEGSKQAQSVTTNINAPAEMNTWKMLKKLDSAKYTEDEDESYSPEHNYDNAPDSSDYDSFDEAEEVSDGELNFLRDGIMDFIAQENRGANEWRSISFLQKIMQETNNVISTRNLRRGVMKGRPTTPSSSHDSGHATSAEVTPTATSSKQKHKEAFWRMKKAFKEFGEDYDSEDDPPYDPSEGSDTGSSKRKGQLRTRKTSYSAKRDPVKPAKDLEVKMHWSVELSSLSGIKFCHHLKKWIPNPDLPSEDEKDPDFELAHQYESDYSDIEIPDEELELIIEDAKKDPEPVPENEKTRDTSDSEGKETEGKKIIKKKTIRPKMIPHWIWYVADMERLRKTSIKKGEGEKNEEANMEGDVDAEVEDVYDSDLDPEYIPSPILDSDCEYDEYSDGEISVAEVALLNGEVELELNEENIGKCTCSEKKKKLSVKKLSEASDDSSLTSEDTNVASEPSNTDDFKEKDPEERTDESEPPTKNLPKITSGEIDDKEKDKPLLRTEKVANESSDTEKEASKEQALEKNPGKDVPQEPALEKAAEKEEKDLPLCSEPASSIANEACIEPKAKKIEIESEVPQQSGSLEGSDEASKLPAINDEIAAT